MQLSKNFTLDEFLVSQTAARKGIPNNPTEGDIENLKLLCLNVLQPLRDAVGRPITVTSGFRSGTLNRAIGGSPTSQHVVGQAADIVIPGIPVIEVCRRIRDTLPFDQLIFEFGSWTHVSFSSIRNRKQTLTIDRAGVRPGF